MSQLPSVEALIYTYLARDWGLANDHLTDTKCSILQRHIRELRTAYQRSQRVRYDDVMVRRAYLASFGPRYARLASTALECERRRALLHCRGWHRREVVIVLFGGGPALEMFGLVEWLYSNDIEPRYIHAVIVDQEDRWRSFHGYWFSEAISARHRKTQIIPSYEPVQVGPGSAQQRTFPYSQAALLSRAELILLTNVLSEIPDDASVRQPLRYLVRLVNQPCLLACIDSNARKWRPRMSWLPTFLDEEPLRSRSWPTASMTVDCGTDGSDATSERIFTGRSPLWVRTVNRWMHLRAIGA